MIDATMNGINDERHRKIEPWSHADDDRWCSGFDLWICGNENQRGSTTIKSKLAAAKAMSDLSLMSSRLRGGAATSTFGEPVSMVAAVVETVGATVATADRLSKRVVWLAGERGKEEEGKEEWKGEKLGPLGNLNQFLA